MSQLDLARLTGCSEGLIAQIETGKRQPGLVNAIRIAAALDVPLRALGEIHVSEAELTALATLATPPEPVDAA